MMVLWTVSSYEESDSCVRKGEAVTLLGYNCHAKQGCFDREIYDRSTAEIGLWVLAGSLTPEMCEG